MKRGCDRKRLSRQAQSRNSENISGKNWGRFGQQSHQTRRGAVVGPPPTITFELSGGRVFASGGKPAHAITLVLEDTKCLPTTLLALILLGGPVSGRRGGSIVVGDGDGVVVGAADLIPRSRCQGEDNGLVVFIDEVVDRCHHHGGRGGPGRDDYRA